MPDRKSLVFTLWLTASLAMLAMALAAPTRTSGVAAASSRPDCLLRHFDLSPGQPAARLSAATDTDEVPQVSALASEDEEQDRVEALDEPRVTFLIPWSFREIPDRLLVAHLSIPSHYPLRC